MKNKTSESDFSYFSERVKYWQEKLSLLDWDIVCIHEYDKDRICAWMIPNDEGRVAQIGLNTIWVDTPITQRRMDGAALHEILEILLRPLTLNTKDQGIRHGVINRLETFVMEGLRR